MSAQPKFTYDDYLKSVGGIPGMSEVQFNEAFGVKTEDDKVPLRIVPKNKPTVKKSLPAKNHIREVTKKVSPKKPKAVKARPSQRKNPKMTEEERKERNEYFARYYAEKKKDPNFMKKRAKHQANYRMSSAA